MKIGVQGLDLWYLSDPNDLLKKKLLLFDKILYHHGNIEILEKLIFSFRNGKKEFQSKSKEIDELESKSLR